MMHELVLQDKITSETSQVRDHTVSISVQTEIGNPSAWLLSESQTSPPLASDPRFSTTIPSSYSFAAVHDPVHGEGLIRTVYMWVKDQSGHVNRTPMVQSIVLGVKPSCTAAVDRNREEKTMAVRLVSNSQSTDSDIIGYLMSESQTEQPAYNDSRFTTSLPSNLSIPFGTRMFVWVKNRYFVSDSPVVFQTDPVVLTEQMRVGHFLLNDSDVFIKNDVNGNVEVFVGSEYYQRHPGEAGYIPGTTDPYAWHNPTYNPVLEGGIGYIVQCDSIARGSVRTVSFTGIQWGE